MSSSTKGKNQINLVFLHGWGGCWQSWFPIIKALEKNYAVFAPDLPGHGQEKINKPLSLSDYSDFIKKYLQTNNIKNPILIGHSFGGAIVCKIAADNLIPLKKIILVDAAPIRYSLTPKQKIISLITKSGKTILSLPIINKIYQPTRKLLYKSLKLENAGYAELTDLIIKKTFSTVIRDDLTSILPNIKVPTLIIWGENDIDTPLIAGQKTHQLIPKSKLIVYPNSSHFSYLENQDLFIKDIKKFIQS